MLIYQDVLGREDTIAQDQSNVFVLVSNCLHLGAEQLKMVLNAAIEHEKSNGQILYDDSENLIQQIIDPVLSRAKAFAARGWIVDAV